MTPGYKTTEFWLSLLALLFAGLLGSGLIGPDSDLSRAIGIASMMLSALGYTASRASVKKSETK